MAIDPRKLRPGECCRLLNSTSLGEVINERQLHRHRTRAGSRIGDGKHVDLLCYTGWLVEERHRPRSADEGDPYARIKDKARERNAAIALAGRDIGELSPVADPDRKAKANSSFQYFCEAYFSLTFHLNWSPDHLKVIRKIEEAVTKGGLFSLAMARGSGKSSLAEVACIWAVLNGYRDFVCLIGSDEGHACDMLDSIKTELDGNDLLLADYPEVCFPIQALDGIANRANGQLYQGKRTQIGWTAKEVVLPTIADSKASGAIIKVAGLTGRIRGMKFKRPDGKTVRPSLVVLDDPQTDESARSLSQCANREAILAGAVLGLAGPGKKISGIMPCTVIRPGDMADSILDRDRHPEWNGERTRMVDSFPTNETLWERYAEIRSEGLRAGDGGSAGTDFYRQNRIEMDAGASVSWKERFNHDELSAIQHAMNLKLQDAAAFFAEYQNEPLPAETVDADQLTAEQVADKINNMPRRSVPIAGNHLTAFIDIQGKLLFYVVAAWEDDFTGYVVDYGSYPDQERTHFTLRDARHTLENASEGTGLEGSIYAGLESLTSDLLGREWQRDDGAAMKIGRCLIDANWGHSTNVVYQFCRQSPHASILLPSHGRFVGASSNPFSEYKRRPGDRVGLNWRVPSINGKRAIRHVIYDTNWWKSFTHARLAVSMGDRGCLSVFGDRPDMHRMFAEQVTAEYYIKTEGRGRTVDEWKARPEQPDNHWLDCLVGCAVAAAMQGALLFGTDNQATNRRDRVSFKDLQRKKRS
ncbi:phage terminase large subunit family protein [bacterium]|nr:phage terminase large subunit family protein [bacterium]